MGKGRPASTRRGVNSGKVAKFSRSGEGCQHFPFVLMLRDLGDESSCKDRKAFSAHSGPKGLSMIRSARRAALIIATTAALVACCAPLASAQPADGLYGRPVAQPYFDFPNWARWSDCRPGPLAWGYEVFPNYGPVDCPCDCVPSVACEEYFVAHRPSDWYATAEYAPLMADPEDVIIARVGPTGPIALETSELETEFNHGGKFTVGRRIRGCYRLEGTFLGNYDWEDVAVATNDDLNTEGGIGDLSTLLSDFSDPIVVGLDGASLVSIAVQHEMWSAEANLRYWMELPPGPFDVSILVGGRYMQINDQFNFLSVADLPLATGTINDVQVNTENELIGVQIGIQGAWLVTTRWWMDLDLKGGIYQNNASQETSFIVDTGPLDETITAVEQDRTAWVGDLSLTANWQMTPTLSFRVGYQALFVHGIALGAQNLEANVGVLPAGPTILDDRGEIVYHGPTIGLTWMR